MIQIRKATKTQSFLRLALIGPAGSGKTYTALRLATVLARAEGKPILVFDTERGSSEKYSCHDDPEVGRFEFDVVDGVSDFSPSTYTEVVAAAEANGYGVLILDSLSHAWAGKGGALEMVDLAAARAKTGGTFAAWREVTSLHKRMVDAIIGARLHVIATMRSKMEYIVETDERGRTTVRKVGLQPVQRDGLEYEFDLAGDLDQSNRLVITKSRCPALSGAVIERPGRAMAETLLAWLRDGDAPSPSLEDTRRHLIELAKRLDKERDRKLIADARLAYQSGDVMRMSEAAEAIHCYLSGVGSGSIPSTLE